MWVALDTDVVQHLADVHKKGKGVFQTFQSSLVSGLRRIHKHAPEFIVTDKIAREIIDAPTTVSARVAALNAINAKVAQFPATNILLAEAGDRNVHREVIDSPFAGPDALLHVRDSDQWASQDAFHKSLRSVMPSVLKDLRRIEKTSQKMGVTRRDLDSFQEFLDELRPVLVRQFANPQMGPPTIRRTKEDYERIWRQSTGIRAASGFVIATFFRRLTKADYSKPGGAMTDLWFVFEAAYCEAVVTRDRDFALSGKLLNDEGVLSAPRFHHLSDLI